MYTEKIGIIDIGSNTIRLVIYAIDHAYNAIELQNIKTPARLSKYVTKNEEQTSMSQEGIDHLIHSLQGFLPAIQLAQVNKLFAFATAAVRQSHNQDQILDQIKTQTGLEVAILSEEEEASYGQYAVLHAVDLADGITVDIGGGSCEVTLFRNKTMVAYHSFPFGALSLKNRFFKDKAHNDPQAIRELKEYVKQAFKSLDWLAKAKLPIVAISGSARNVAYVHQSQTDYPMGGLEGYRMNLEELKATAQLFEDTTLSGMSNIDGLSNDRIDTILPANLVFIQLCQVVKTQAFLLSNQGLRQGFILKHINQNYHSPVDTQLIKVRAVQQLARKMELNPPVCQLRVDYSLKLYRQACELGIFDYSYQQQVELELAAYLYCFGASISPEADSQHSFYILTNSSLLGFNHEERLRLALLASYTSRSAFKYYLQEFKTWLTDDHLSQLQRLGGLIKFARAINDSQTGAIRDLTLVPVKKDRYQLLLKHQGPVVAEKYRSKRQLKHLERALGGKVSLQFQERSTR